MTVQTVVFAIADAPNLLRCVAAGASLTVRGAGDAVDVELAAPDPLGGGWRFATTFSPDDDVDGIAARLDRELGDPLAAVWSRRPTRRRA